MWLSRTDNHVVVKDRKPSGCEAQPTIWLPRTDNNAVANHIISLLRTDNSVVGKYIKPYHFVAKYRQQRGR